MQNVQHRIHRHQVNTLRDLFRIRASQTPDSIAYQFKDRKSDNWESITWKMLFQKMRYVRNALASERLNAKDRILIALPNSIEWVLIEQAAHELGLIPVSLPANSAASTLHHIAAETDAKILFIESVKLIPSLNAYRYFSDNSIKMLGVHIGNNLSDSNCFNSWLDINKTFQSPKRHPIRRNALATIIYTSGTTGKPKGVMHSHESLLNNAFASIEKIDLNETDRLLSVTPISHCMERIAGYYAPMIANAAVSFPIVNNDITAVLQEVNPTVLITPPSLIHRAYDKATDYGTLCNFDNFFGFINKLKVERRIHTNYLKSLRYIFTGGAKVPDHVTALCKTLKLPVIQGYGLTEAGGIVCTNLPKQNLPGSIGKPIAGVNLSLSDDNEVLVSSNSMMLGYWKNPQLTAKVLKNGLLSTNDIGENKANYFYIHDRKHQKIHLSTGEKLSPFPLEQRIKQDHLFKYAMIYGESREKLAVICNLDKAVLKNVLNRVSISNRNINQRRELKSEITKLISIRVNTIIKQVPNHLPIELVIPTFEPWTELNGLLNAKGKMNRENIEQKYLGEIEKVYANLR